MVTPTEEVESSSPLELLLALQDVDLSIDRLEHRRAHLEEARTLAELEARRHSAELALAELDARRTMLATERDRLEGEVDRLVERSRSIEARASSSASYRDTEAMASEVGQLGERLRALEDEELAAMEKLEPLDTERAEKISTLGALEVELEAARAARDRAEEEIAAELRDIGVRRASLAPRLDDALRGEYERLRSRLDGIGVGRLEHGMCTGCRLTLAATELDAIKRAPVGTLVHCEQCGRILVP